MQSHLEFQVVTPAMLPAFAGPVLIMPDVKCLSPSETEALRSFVAAGKSLVVTGETGRYDQRGEARNENPVRRLLGVKRPERTESGTARVRFIYDPTCPERVYWRQLTEEFDSCAAQGTATGSRFDSLRSKFIHDLIRVSGYRPDVDVAASPFVTAQIAQVNGTPHVFLANFKGLRSKENATQLPERNVTISFRAKPGARIRMLPFLGAVEDLKPVNKGGRTVVVVPEMHRGAVVWIE